MQRAATGRGVCPDNLKHRGLEQYMAHQWYVVPHTASYDPPPFPPTYPQAWQRNLNGARTQITFSVIRSVQHRLRTHPWFNYHLQLYAFQTQRLSGARPSSFCKNSVIEASSNTEGVRCESRESVKTRQPHEHGSLMHNSMNFSSSGAEHHPRGSKRGKADTRIKGLRIQGISFVYKEGLGFTYRLRRACAKQTHSREALPLTKLNQGGKLTWATLQLSSAFPHDRPLSPPCIADRHYQIPYHIPYHQIPYQGPMRRPM